MTDKSVENRNIDTLNIADEQQANRDYKTTKLPTPTAKVELANQKDILFKLYDQICASWRMLTDVRFKLLGFIPVVSGVVLFSLLSNKQDGPSPSARMGISIFGLLITIALFIYEKRNTELYNYIISRGRKIEAELGMETGLFLGRLSSSIKFIRHDVAINLIYCICMSAWLAAFLMIYFRW